MAALVLVLGAGNVRHDSGCSPTGTVGVLVYRAADAIVYRCLADPGPLD